MFSLRNENDCSLITKMYHQLSSNTSSGLLLIFTNDCCISIMFERELTDKSTVKLN